MHGIVHSLPEHVIYRPIYFYDADGTLKIFNKFAQVSELKGISVGCGASARCDLREVQYCATPVPASNIMLALNVVKCAFQAGRKLLPYEARIPESFLSGHTNWRCCQTEHHLFRNVSATPASMKNRELIRARRLADDI